MKNDYIKKVKTLEQTPHERHLMKRYSRSYATGKMQITIMGHILGHIRTVNVQDTDNAKCWQECGATGTLTHCCGNAKWYKHYVKQFGSVLQN